jgi:hypothetical protein
MNIRAQIFGTGSDRPEPELLKKKKSKGARSDTLTSVAIPREATRRSNSRDEDRFRLNGERVVVTFRGREREAEVINLSGGGAMIECDLEPNIGECLEVHLGEEGTVDCMVRWIKDGRLGLEFAHETKLQCSSNEQADLLREVIQKAFPEEKFVPPQPQDDGSDNRVATRHPLIWSGELVHGSHRWQVRLRNISATGALVDFPGQLRLGSEVLLDLGNAGQVTASVSWVMGDQLGLHFDEPFEMIRLSQAQPRVAPPTWLRPAYLEKDVAEDSAWDEAWSRMSVDELRQELEGYLKR